MSCQCAIAKDLPSVITTLTIGTASANTAYKVYFETPTGRIDQYSATSNGSGVISITNTGFRIGEIYEVWITTASANINDRTAFTVSGESVTCVYVEFKYTGATFSTQSITLTE